MSDWPVEANGDRVRGESFRFEQYRQASPGWDHDHCELCMAKFMEGGAYGSLPEGYVAKQAADIRTWLWVCPECWNDLHDVLNLRLED